MSEPTEPPPPKPRRRWRWKAVGVGLIGLTVLFAHSTRWFSAFGGTPHGKRLERMKASSHWQEGVFINPIETPDGLTGPVLPVLWRWMAGPEERNPPEPPPVTRLSAEDFANPSPEGLRVTWFGHSTVLIEIDGRRILTDPIFSERSSPSTLVGPKRFHEPPVAIADLPRLDAVLISHDHYDHLDELAIRELATTGVPFFVPLGVGAHLDKWEVPALQIQEHDWWEETKAGGGRITVIATPSRHFSGRGLFDRNRTQWASWVLWGPEHRVYFSGDTGMFPGFREIGEAYGPFDLTLLEVGAYDDAWESIHLGPEGAVEAHQMLGGKAMLPIHWGTFNLALHAWDQPMRRTQEIATAKGIRLLSPRPGERISL